MEYTNEMKVRLKRIEGQVRGVIGMMERDSHCKDVIHQLAAVRSAVDRTMASIVAANLQHCIVTEIEAGRKTSKVVEEAVELLVKSR